MYEQEKQILGEPAKVLLDYKYDGGDFACGLRENLAWVLQRNGFDKDSEQSIAEVFAAKLGEEATDELVNDMKYAAELVRDIHLELRADQSKPGDVATRAGVSQQDIAQTLRDTAEYLKQCNVGPQHNKIAERFLKSGGLADQIENTSQEGLRQIFGKGDGQHYWPGKVIPTLIDVRGILKFQAYREKLEGSGSEAQLLIDRIDAFRGTFGSCHCACTGEDQERYAYIKQTERHPSEVYIQPREPYVNTANTLNYAYNWTNNDWLPICENRVECRAVVGGESTYSGSDYLASHKATLEEGFRRAKIGADVTVELGKTYGEDAVVVQMSVPEYEKFIKVKQGKRKFDAKDPNSEYPVMGPNINKHYVGFEVGKRAFYGPEGLYVEDAALGADHKDSAAIAKRLKWLEESESLETRKVTLDDGRNRAPTSFTVFVHNRARFDGPPKKIDNRYYDSCDLHNTFNAKRSELYDLVNESEPRRRGSVARTQKPGTEVIESEGRIYTPHQEPYQQVGRHFETIHGLRSKWVIAGNFEPTPAGLVERESYHGFFLDELPEDKREAVRTELLATLDSVRRDIKAGGDGMIGLADPSRRSE